MGYRIEGDIVLAYIHKNISICTMLFKPNNHRAIEQSLQEELAEIAAYLSADLGAITNWPTLMHWMTANETDGMWGIQYDYFAEEDISQLSLAYPKGLVIPESIVRP